MKRKLFLCLMLAGLGNFAKAQSPATLPVTNAPEKYDGVKGYFNYALNSRETMVVAYNFAPARPSGKSVLYLQTPTAMPLWVSITDQSGRVVKKWMPDQQSYKYETGFDFSKLRKGIYQVHINVGSTENAQSFEVVKE